jgi:hypothetical protein
VSTDAVRAAIEAARHALAAAEALLCEDAETGAPVPRYADASENPIGSARAFLDAARAGHFATFKRGRKVSALWADVERWIESRHRSPVTRPPAPVDVERAELERAGVRFAKGGRR